MLKIKDVRCMEGLMLRSKIKKKYKVAVCLYGHMRTFSLCAPFFKLNLLRYYNYDLFIHTWSKLDHNTKTWHKYQHCSGDVTAVEIHKAYGDINKLVIEEQGSEELGYTCRVSDVEEKISGLIAVTEKDIEKVFVDAHQEYGFSLFGMKSVMHSMANAISFARDHVKQQQVNYDYVVVTRPDIWLKVPFLIDSILTSFTDGEINQNIITSKTHYDFKENICGIDLLFLAKPELIFECMENRQYVINQLLTKSAFFYNPESVFFQILRHSGYDWRPLPLVFKKDYNILRPL